MLRSSHRRHVERWNDQKGQDLVGEKAAVGLGRSDAVGTGRQDLLLAAGQFFRPISTVMCASTVGRIRRTCGKSLTKTLMGKR